MHELVPLRCSRGDNERCISCLFQRSPSITKLTLSANRRSSDPLGGFRRCLPCEPARLTLSLPPTDHNPYQSYRDLLRSVRDILGRRYNHKPQLATSHQIVRVAFLWLVSTSIVAC